MNDRYIVAVTGASGTIYAIRLLRYMLSAGHDVDFVISDAGVINFKLEMDWDLDTRGINEFFKTCYGESITRGKLRQYPVDSVSAPIGSGTVNRKAMIVIPCSMKTMAGIANGFASNLIERAADVALKERTPLVVVPRESPMNIIQIENMLKLAKAGAVIVPAMPAFYNKPVTIEELADFIAARVLNVIGVKDHGLTPAWGE